MSKEGNNYRDEFIRAMDDLQFRLTHKNVVAKLEAGEDDLTIRGCFFTGICSYGKFHEFCSQYHFKEYDDKPEIKDDVLERALNRFFDRLWGQEKTRMFQLDFDLEQAKEYCANVVADIAGVYVHWLREIYACRGRIASDYFSTNLKHLRHHLID